jgi:hypothetical protein
MLDIYDGCVYQVRYEFFRDPYNISFCLNYDGAPKFKSSNLQLWPIQLCINELPPRSRYNFILYMYYKTPVFTWPLVLVRIQVPVCGKPH